jgi:hypothetical protein
MHDDEPMDPMDIRMDDRLRALAGDAYNAADGSVPREEMWARISAARRAARAVPTANPDLPRIAPAIVPLRRSRPVVWRWSAALAAGLILGVVADKLFVRTTSRGASRANVVATDTMPRSTQEVAIGSTPPSESTEVTAPYHRNRDSSVRGSAAPRDLPRTAAPRDSTRRDLASASPGSVDRTPTTTPDSRDLYHAAAMQTLVQAEALLTAYRANGDAARDPQALQQAARWARDVLSSTRLLMDSPAARDPQMRALFTDLELVLAQIVQLSGAPLQGPERELIERAMRERDLLPRLRTAVPAGTTS